MSGGTGARGIGAALSGLGATPYSPQAGVPNFSPGQPQPPSGLTQFAPASTYNSGAPSYSLAGQPADVSTGGKGGQGGQQAQPAVMPSRQPQQPQYAPLAPQGQFNVNQASAGALQQAMRGTQAGMGFQPERARAAGYRPSSMNSQGYNAQGYDAQGYNAKRAGSQGFTAANVANRGYDASQVGPAPIVTAQSVQAGQLAGKDLGAYTNPYENQVVQQTLSDLARNRDMTLNQQGAQATAANAFGGSRQAIADSETQRAFAEQSARAASGLRQAGFTQAQQMAQQDIGTAQQAALANQQANLQAATTTGQFGQQSSLANQAALNQASQFGAAAFNQAQAQQSAQQQQAAQFAAAAANQASLANAAAANQASQFGAGAQNTAGQFGAGAQNTAGQFGASAANQAAAANMAAQNQAAQFGAGASNQMSLANQSAGLQANQQRLGAASQLGGLGQQAFNTGQTIQQNQMQQGLLQQSMQQRLIDAAKQQYGGYTGAPMQSLSAPLAALGQMANGQNTQTDSQNPGLLSYIQAIGAICWVAREVYGEDNPKWLQFREWVIGYSPNWFYKAYSKYGEKMAAVVAKVPALKAIIRPFMDAKRKALGYK